MKKHLVIATLITLAGAMLAVPAQSADKAADSAQVKLQSASLPALRQSLASTGGYELKSLELKHSAHQLTAVIVDSKLNAAAPVDREKEAVAMASAMEGGIAGKPEFEGVASMHVDYVSRVAKKPKTIQIFDFFRSPANVFVLHKT
jgi:hypothetical protein